MQLLQDLSGVRNLKWETEPDNHGREVQWVVDSHGRILGWLSWDSERPVTRAAMRFMPFGPSSPGACCCWPGFRCGTCARLGYELAAANERTRRLAREDPVSGLPAATAILETLEHTLAQREPDEFVTLCYLDLTGFRELADTFGRPWSHDLVRAAADRLRELDWPGSALGRLGRHRFILLLRAKDPDAGMRMAEEVDNLISSRCSAGPGVYLRAEYRSAYSPRDG